MRVVYLQPYVPTYRVPLFDALHERLNAGGGALRVLSRQVSGTHSQRGDASTGPWSVQVPGWSLDTPVGEFKFRRRVGRYIRSADLCVMELDAGNLNAWWSLSSGMRPKLILWGHGKSFVSASMGPQDRMRRVLAGTAEHVMTYSPAGREHLIAGGIAESRVTCVGNATDTRRLRTLLDSRLGRPLHRSEAFDVSVKGRNVACYVGGLDQDKRIPFLVSAARTAYQRDPRFLLLVAGSGVDQRLLQSAGEAIRWRPHATPADLADLAAVSRSFWMPGRVGLIAVDALALGRPLLTTPFPFHAPEYELLTPGRTVYVMPDEPTAFAREALALQTGLPLWPSPAEPGTPTIESVAEAMVGVLTTAMKREA
jgi:glycosyltransferase involved in cell wall biosynthesis